MDPKVIVDAVSTQHCHEEAKKGRIDCEGVK